MTRIQRIYSFFLAVVLLGMTAFLPDLFFLRGNLYRHLREAYLPGEGAASYQKMTDLETLAEITESNIEYSREMAEKWRKEKEAQQNNKAERDKKEKQQTEAQRKESQYAKEIEQSQAIERKALQEEKKEGENGETIESEQKAEGKNREKKEKTEMTEEIGEIEETAAGIELRARPQLDLSAEKLANEEYLLNQFFIVDENTSVEAAKLNAKTLLQTDLSIEKQKTSPQILIYHSHSQESFADSREGAESDSIVGVGDYLTELLEKNYGYQVLHIKEKFDLMSGTLDRSKAYDYARSYLEEVLEQYPSVEVVIDLHRDGVPEDRHLVTTIDGKEMAQVLFYNGLSYTKSQGKVSYLPNPYIQENLAFSFQLEYESARYYPGLYRGIYLAGLRYNLHLKPRALLLEAGAQTNTLLEVKNSMEPIAFLLDLVLSGNVVCPE